MSNSDVIQRLLEELNNQNQIYITIITVILTILGLGFSLFSFMQWRFSERQIKKIETDFKKDFKISEIHEALQNFELKNKQLEQAIKDAKSAEKLMLERLHELQNYDLEGKTNLLTPVVSNGDIVQSANSIKTVNRALKPIIKDNVLLPDTYQQVMTDISNMLYIIVKNKFPGNNDFNGALSRLIKTVNEYYEHNIQNIQNTNLKIADSIIESKQYIENKHKEYLDQKAKHDVP
ncbi:hypothetical protein [Lactiplantibacillus plantarum]|uniref:hypothetical protein n=1 Tax=Lactiplantibacillus plantarum TaxID=1590 RepID=UPI0012FC596F|nr:hypothetical protein [Lactiplantibacillus plantarum]KAE9506702.1 hypothetical protein FET70_00101 [Lactiplantibacillus plantarum]